MPADGFAVDSASPGDLAWSGWLPLDAAWKNPLVPRTAGLYRIRRVGRRDLDYIGQTGSGGMNLRKRLAMLKGIFGDEMPYRDPHTAGPALWVLVQEGSVLEVSTATVEGTTPWRKGLEAVAIALYRQQHRCSPSVNFGRMPFGYTMSSGNNAKLVAAGNRFRGGITADAHACHAPGVEPTGALDGPPQGGEWVGLRWSNWQPLAAAVASLTRASGVYRIRSDEGNQLLYIGEGVIGPRLEAHLRKCDDENNMQGDIFASANRLECSYVVNESWLHHQRLEVENDLIAAHVLMTNRVPEAQFIG
jgi:hypothetical protein